MDSPYKINCFETNLHIAVVTLILCIKYDELYENVRSNKSKNTHLFIILKKLFFIISILIFFVYCFRVHLFTYIFKQNLL